MFCGLFRSRKPSAMWPFSLTLASLYNKASSVPICTRNELFTPGDMHAVVIVVASWAARLHVGHKRCQLFLVQLQLVDEIHVLKRSHGNHLQWPTGGELADAENVKVAPCVHMLHELRQLVGGAILRPGLPRTAAAALGLALRAERSHELREDKLVLAAAQVGRDGGAVDAPQEVSDCVQPALLLVTQLAHCAHRAGVVVPEVAQDVTDILNAALNVLVLAAHVRAVKLATVAGPRRAAP
eukprot:363267-Chlamydomonas_euryale.AAC.13